MNKLSLIALLLLFVFTAKAQSNAADKGIVMLKNFYRAYITASSEHDSDLDVMEAKLNALKHQYCTKAAQKRIEVLTEETDADPIIQAQDSDLDMLKTLVIKKDNKNQHRYAVTYMDSDRKAKTTIYVTLQTEKNVLKIGYIE